MNDAVGAVVSYMNVFDATADVFPALSAVFAWTV